MPARQGSDRCVSHDPAYAGIQRMNARRGGRNSGLARAKDSVDIGEFSFASTSAVQQVIERIFVLVLRGGVSRARRREFIRLASLAVENLHHTPRPPRPATPVPGDVELSDTVWQVFAQLLEGTELPGVEDSQFP
jgi:hypothetical protein